MQPPPVELIQRIDEALVIARAMSSGPQASDVDQLLAALLAVRQQALSGTLEASRGGSSLGLTRGVADWIDSRDAPILKAVARTETQLLGPRDLSAYRWTLDTRQDLDWFRAVAACIPTRPPDPMPHALLALLAENPALRRYDAPVVYR